MNLKSWLYLSIARNRGKRLPRAIARAARSFLDAYEARSLWQLHNDGELAVLDALSAMSPRVVFDVGANIGDWSRAAAARFPNAVIHAFELVPSTAAELARRVAVEPRIIVNEFGLADKAGALFANVPAEFASPLSTTTSRMTSAGWRQVQCRTEVGFEYAERAGIDRIDVLKIDTEGADYRVLRGFEPLFEAESVGVVQFEYGPWALETRNLLCDFYELLEAYGFSVGKLYPAGVEFGPYDPLLEDFRGLNFVAVHRSLPAIACAVASSNLR